MKKYARYSLFICSLLILIYEIIQNMDFIGNATRKQISCSEYGILKLHGGGNYSFTTGIKEGPLKHNNTIPARIVNIENASSLNLFAKSMDQVDNTTIVTAYFNLGSFRKGQGFLFIQKYYGTKRYYRWASVFRRILNPIVIYTDNDEFANYMTELRKYLRHKTTILKIKRNDTWAFQLHGKICSVFKQPDYPFYSPNTERADYSCAMHSKFELVKDAIRRDIYKTAFYQWLDIGLFRDIISDARYFKLNPPKAFDRTKIAYTRVYQNQGVLTPEAIIKGNLVWVGGATFLGRRDILLKFIRLYMKAIQYFISQDLINTDQQMLYAIYSNTGRKNLNPDVEIQEFVPPRDSNVDCWFYLGYLCREIVT